MSFFPYFLRLPRNGLFSFIFDIFGKVKMCKRINFFHFLLILYNFSYILCLFFKKILVVLPKMASKNTNVGDLNRGRVKHGPGTTLNDRTRACKHTERPKYRTNSLFCPSHTILKKLGKIGKEKRPF